MDREKLIWTILLVGGGLFLLGRATFTGMGQAYVREVIILQDDANPDGRWRKYEQTTQTEYNKAMAADPNQTTFRKSFWRTVGIWTAALFTLFVFSFLYRDNPFYKLAESVFVGVSAAYWMVVGFWDTIVPNLIGKLSPALIRSWSTPGLSETETTDLVYLVPLALGVMLLWRLAPVGGWISRWPMAFIIGVFCGLRLVSFLHADFLSQIRNTIIPLYVRVEEAGQLSAWSTLWASLRAIALVVGVLACLVYFFFSIEHRGVVGKTAKLGIWFLMVTFGAAFGYTVMGRIALLAARIEFLVDDWLWIIDPTDKREAVEAAVGLITYLPMLT